MEVEARTTATEVEFEVYEARWGVCLNTAWAAVSKARLSSCVGGGLGVDGGGGEKVGVGKVADSAICLSALA